MLRFCQTDNHSDQAYNCAMILKVFCMHALWLDVKEISTNRSQSAVNTVSAIFQISIVICAIHPILHGHVNHKAAVSPSCYKILESHSHRIQITLKSIMFSGKI